MPGPDRSAAAPGGPRAADGNGSPFGQRSRGGCTASSVARSARGENLPLRRAVSTCFHAPALSRAASHAAVSAIVSRQRPRREARGCARAQSIAMKPALSGSLGGSHSGSPIHGSTPCASSVASSIHAGAGGAATRRRARRRDRPSSSARAGLHGVERAADVALGEIEHPRREIARVDELHRRARAAPERRRAPAAIAEQRRMHEARDPVAEAVGAVERSDDEARPHLRRARAESRSTTASHAAFSAP